MVFMLLVSLHAHVSMSTEARPLTPDKEQSKSNTTSLFLTHSTIYLISEMLLATGYVEVLQSLGIRCRCCDGVGGECRSTWASHCAKLECHPSKFL